LLGNQKSPNGMVSLRASAMNEGKLRIM